MAKFLKTDFYLKFSDKPTGKAKPVLWPVLVHRVLYPEINDRQMNLFQRAVLSLIKAGVYKADDIANLTSLHTDLVKLIFAQTIGEDWLNDKANRLTEKGIKALDNDETTEINLKVGYVFQDAINGKLWPRFEISLTEITAKNSQDKYPELIVSRKKGWSIKPYVLHATSTKLTELSLPILKDAYDEYSKDYFKSRQLNGSSNLQSHINIQGIQSVDSNPNSAYVLLWIVPGIQDQSLSVSDPFELRKNAWWLNEQLPSILEKNKVLFSSLARLIDQPNPEKQTYKEWSLTVEKNIDFQIITAYPWAEKLPDIKRYLSNLLHYQEEIDQGDIRLSTLEAAVIESQKLLEVLMQWLIKKHQSSTGSIPSKGKFDRTLNEKILTSLNIPAFKSSVIKQLAGQKLVSIIKTIESPSSSLKALVFAAALGVIGKPEHPFMQINSNEFDFIRLLKLADIRNTSGHGQSKYIKNTQPKLTPDEVQEYIKFAIGFTECFKEWM